MRSHIDDRSNAAEAEADGFAVDDLGGEHLMAVRIAPEHRADLDPLARLAAETAEQSAADDRPPVRIDADLGLADAGR